jgi:hypothetical protein
MTNKKELTESYKQMTFRIGVFQIKNKTNGRVFVESSMNLDKIYNRHRVELNFGTHRNADLQQDWTRLGEENFTYEIIAELDQDDSKKIDYKKELAVLEQLCFEELQPYENRGYHHRKKT